MSSIPELVTLDRITQAIESSPSFRNDLLRGLSDAFVAYERGDFAAAPIQTLGAPPLPPFVVVTDQTNSTYAAQTCVKSGYFVGDEYFVIKVASGGHPFPSNTGHLQVYSQSTGELKALLLDNGILTEIRTAAVGSLVVQKLGPKTVQSVGVLGTGIQARYQLKYLAETLSSVDEAGVSLFLYGRSEEKAEILKEDLEKDLPSSWTKNISIVERPEELLTNCDVVITTTSAREPVLRRTDAMRTRLIVCIGSDAPGKQELSDDLVNAADLLVADSLAQTRERGEFQRYCSDMDGTGDIVSLGEILSKDTVNRAENDGLVIFDSSGVALQDCVIAKMVYTTVNETSV